MKKLFIILLLPFLFLACKKEEVQKVTEEKFAFGTYISITAYDKDEKLAKKAIEAAFEEMDRVDKKFNSKVETSIIGQLNSGTIKEATLDDEGVYLIKKIQDVYELSHGKYDVTVGPLLNVWNFEKGSREDVPTPEELAKAMKNIDFTQVKLDGNKLYFGRKGITIDTGSFLKGYAVEKAKNIMREMGIKSAFITSVSSIETINTKPGGKDWVIGIENPLDSSKILGTVHLNNEGMGVSGDYQTYVEIKGQRYHHILDKATGYPISTKKMVVVISNNAFYCDLYSTAFFTMPIDEVLAFAEKNELGVIIVDSHMNIYRSEGLKFEMVK